MTIFERVQALELPAGEYAVFSGGVLEALGIRRAGDVDLVVTSGLYQQLKESGWTEVRGANAVTLNRDGVEVALPEEYVPDGAGIEDARVLITDPIVIQGISFVRPEYVIACKRRYENPKHRPDVVALEAYLADHPEARKP